MYLSAPLDHAAVNGLAMALIESSCAPLVLLDDELVVIGASQSFCDCFELDPEAVSGRSLATLGEGEWNVPQLHSLLQATIAGDAAISAYEMDLERPGKATCRLVLSAHRLDYFHTDRLRIVLSATDVTAARLAERQKDDLVRDKQILFQELQHRVANSLQIIASVLMQSARRVQSEETRFHLHDAHHRVMSIATLQKQLATSDVTSVKLRDYLASLCDSIAASMIDDHKRLTLVVAADDSETSSDKSVSIGLIVTELVINTIKHAFPGRNHKGAIKVDYSVDGDGWLLSVEDDGIGMSTDPAVVKPGLGTGIIAALAKQLSAVVSVIDAKPGTRVEIRKR